MGTGYRVSDYPEEKDVEVFADNWTAIELFRLYSDQWRLGPNGPVALDLNVFQHHLQRIGVEGDEYETIIAQLGVIQSQALRRMQDDD